MRRLVTAAVAGTVLVFAAPASAATTIGPGVGSASSNLYGCNIGQSCVIASESHPSVAVAAPISGVLVRWRVRIGMNPGTLRVRMLRSEGAGHRRVAASGAPVTTAGGEIVERSERIRVSAGDLVGFEGFSASANFFFDPETVGSMFRSFNGSYPDGSTVPGTASSNFNLKFDATIEPDGDGDGWGDDTQDHCPTDASTHDTCRLPVQQTTPPPLSPAPPDTTAPGLANVIVVRGRLLYTLSEAATVQTTVQRSLEGRRVGGKCVKPTKANRRARRCKRWVGTRTSDAPGGAGAQSTSLNTQLLAAGAYRVKVLARDAAGNAATKTVKFRRRR